MDTTVKKRGRKKTVPSPVEEVPVQQEELVKKKRGRKKKWETTPFKNNYLSEKNEKVTFKESGDIDTEKYTTNALNFGNLCIKVHDNKETDQEVNLDNYFVDKKDAECSIELSSDEEDTTCVKKDNSRQLRHYVNNSDVTNLKLRPVDTRCYHCHHAFDNPPFFLPFDYSCTLDRYKLFGNFCSPNCVKTYCMNHKSFENKVYLVGQFYRKLFGPEFRIGPAPSIYSLKEYGGKMSIEEFRKSSYKNSRYTINNLNCKVIFIN